MFFIYWRAIIELKHCSSVKLSMNSSDYWPARLKKFSCLNIFLTIKMSCDSRNWLTHILTSLNLQLNDVIYCTSNTKDSVAYICSHSLNRIFSNICIQRFIDPVLTNWLEIQNNTNVWQFFFSSWLQWLTTNDTVTVHHPRIFF